MRIQRHVIFEKCTLGITCKGGRDQNRVGEEANQGGGPSGRLAVALSHHKLAGGGEMVPQSRSSMQPGAGLL